MLETGFYLFVFNTLDKTCWCYAKASSLLKNIAPINPFLCQLNFMGLFFFSCFIFISCCEWLGEFCHSFVGDIYEF